MKEIAKLITNDRYKDELDIRETKDFFHFYASVDGCGNHWKIRKKEMLK